MSLSPDNAPQSSADPPVELAVRPRSWQNRLLRICFVIFTLEIGLFLAIFPWMDETWSVNAFQEIVPVLQSIWIEPYFRGAVTGLGLVNIFIALQEIARLLRRS
jgi:hypothetical protein